MKGTPITTFSALHGIESLEYLNLENTNISIFTSSKLKLSLLKVLYLSGSPLVKINLNLGLRKLEELYVDNTKISIINMVQQSLPRLRMLEAGHTFIKDLTFLYYLPSLEALHLSDVKLQSPNQTLPELPNLQDLSLARNNLTYLDISLTPNLQYLDIKGNLDLKNISYDMGKPPNYLLVYVTSGSIQCTSTWLKHMQAPWLMSQDCEIRSKSVMMTEKIGQCSSENLQQPSTNQSSSSESGKRKIS